MHKTLLTSSDKAFSSNPVNMTEVTGSSLIVSRSDAFTKPPGRRVVSTMPGGIKFDLLATGLVLLGLALVDVAVLRSGGLASVLPRGPFPSPFFFFAIFAVNVVQSLSAEVEPALFVF